MKSNYREQVQTHGIGWYGATWMRPGGLPTAVVFRFTEYLPTVKVIPIPTLEKVNPVANVDQLFAVTAITKAMKSLTK